MPQYLVIAVPVDTKFDEDQGKYVPTVPQPPVKAASAPQLVTADNDVAAAQLLAQTQQPEFPAEYLVLAGDPVTVGLTATSTAAAPVA